LGCLASGAVTLAVGSWPAAVAVAVVALCVFSWIQASYANEHAFRAYYELLALEINPSYPQTIESALGHPSARPMWLASVTVSLSALGYSVLGDLGSDRTWSRVHVSPGRRTIVLAHGYQSPGLWGRITGAVCGVLIVSRSIDGALLYSSAGDAVVSHPRWIHPSWIRHTDSSGCTDLDQLLGAHTQALDEWEVSVDVFPESMQDYLEISGREQERHRRWRRRHGFFEDEVRNLPVSESVAARLLKALAKDIEGA